MLNNKKKKKELDDELKNSLKDIIKICENEDEFVRKAQIRTWKKNEEFWHGVQYLFWNEKDQTWISPQSGAAPNLGFSMEETQELGPFYDFVINIFLGHGQSIISALSAQVPAIKFLPDDGNDDKDIDTAKTFDKIAELVARHNDAKLKFIKTLFFLYINPLVAAYRYIDTDKKYGVYKVPVFQNQEVEQKVCPICGAEIVGGDDESLNNAPVNLKSDESQDVEESNAPQHTSDEGIEGTEETGENQDTEEINQEQEQELVCPNCGSLVEPQLVKKTIPIHAYDEDKPKSRVKYEIFGSLFVKIPVYAFDQDSCGYLGLYLDKPKDELVANFCYDEKGKLDRELAKKIESEYMINQDRFARNEYQYPTGPEMENREMSTLIQYWLRPSKFNLEKDFDKREKLLETFPKGCKVVLIGKNKVFVSADEEELDKRWTLGKAGLSTYVHGDPICQPLVPIQEMRNNLDNLIMDTIEHGIPSTFVDSEVLDFDAYGRFEALPGYMFKAKARPGKTLGESFFVEPKAQVPREVGTYRQALDKDAQFTVGSFPSLYGGPSEGKSRTLGEYQQSRQQALQRLMLIWVYVADFYRRNMEEMCRMFAEMMIEDEYFTKLSSNGNYITVWIKKSQLAGKIGGVESEASDQFPMSIQQIQIFLEKFIELNNPQINAALYAPENRKVLQDYFMLNKLKMPGRNQIYKQVVEINKMLNGVENPLTGQKTYGPIAVPNPQNPGQTINQSSVPIDPLVDDDAIHISELKDFMTDDIGLDLKDQQPLIYADLEAHLKAHQLNLQLKTMTQFESSPPGEAPDTTETSDAGGDE